MHDSISGLRSFILGCEPRKSAVVDCRFKGGIRDEDSASPGCAADIRRGKRQLLVSWPQLETGSRDTSNHPHQLFGGSCVVWLYTLLKSFCCFIKRPRLLRHRVHSIQVRLLCTDWRHCSRARLKLSWLEAPGLCSSQRSSLGGGSWCKPFPRRLLVIRSWFLDVSCIASVPQHRPTLPSNPTPAELRVSAMKTFVWAGDTSCVSLSWLFHTRFHTPWFLLSQQPLGWKFNA